MNAIDSEWPAAPPLPLVEGPLGSSAWHPDYNTVRPHLALTNQTTDEFPSQCAAVAVSSGLGQDFTTQEPTSEWRKHGSQATTFQTNNSPSIWGNVFRLNMPNGSFVLERNTFR